METKYRKMETYAFIAILARATKARCNGIEVPFARIFAPCVRLLLLEMKCFQELLLAGSPRGS